MGTHVYIESCVRVFVHTLIIRTKIIIINILIIITRSYLYTHVWYVTTTRAASYCRAVEDLVYGELLDGDGKKS